MPSFYLKHPTKSDFWVNQSNVEMDAPFFWAFKDIKEFLRNKDNLHNLSPEHVKELIAKIDVFDAHPNKEPGWHYTTNKKYANRKNHVLRILAPMSFGASHDQYAHEFNNLQAEVIDPLRLCIEYAEKLNELKTEIVNKVFVFPAWSAEEAAYFTKILSNNPFTKVKIWNKTLQNNSFNVIEASDQTRLYSSKAYAVFLDDGKCGYYAHKASNAVSLSEATLFDSVLLAKRQKHKLGNKNAGIIEVDIQFKKIVENPETIKDIDKLQAYYDKEAISQFFAQHNIEKLKEELARLESQNKELKSQHGLEEHPDIRENTTPVKRLNKI